MTCSAKSVKLSTLRFVLFSIYISNPKLVKYDAWVEKYPRETNRQATDWEKNICKHLMKTDIWDIPMKVDGNDLGSFLKQ